MKRLEIWLYNIWYMENFYDLFYYNMKYINIGHRGSKGLYRENTIRSIYMAQLYNCDMIEIDLRQSRDGIFFMKHDEDCSFIHSNKRRIEDEDANVVFANGYEYAMSGISQILQTANAYLDLKVGLIEDTDINYLRSYAENLLSQLKSYGFNPKNVYIGSINKKLMDIISDLDERNEYNLGLIYCLNEEVKEDDISRGCFSFYVLDHKTHNIKTVCQKIKQDENNKVYVYTVNTNLDIYYISYYCFNLIDGIVSDYPNRVSEFIKYN